MTTAPTSTMPSPAEAWELLASGNARYVADAPSHPHLGAARRTELAYEQHPFATIVGCGDSRASIDHIFDIGLGDAFEVRNAGHVISESALGSVEYGAGPLATPLLVVLAHERCGAVRAAIDAQAPDATPLPPHIAATIAPIAAAVHTVAGTADGEALDPDAVDAAEVGRTHLRTTIDTLLRDSEIISSAVAEGTLAIVGGYYRLAEGTVEAVVTIGLD